MSEIDSDKILSTPPDIPHSVELVLRKVEEDELVVLPETTRRSELRVARNQLLTTLDSLLQSNLDKEMDFSRVLQWHREKNQELLQLEMDEDIRAADGITEEQIEEMHQNIQRFMSDTQASVMRLKELSGFLFARDAEKRKKLENALHKGGVWCWWWEPKDDARTILKIHELQPPSARMFLMDPSLATKSSFDLSFMVGNMAKSLSCSQPMNMAFEFVQNGFHNLNEAFQERTNKAQHLQAQLDEVKAEDCRSKAELGVAKRRIVQLECDKYSLQEEIAEYKIQISNLQHMFQTGQKGPVMPLIGLQKSPSVPTKDVRPLSLPRKETQTPLKNVPMVKPNVGKGSYDEEIPHTISLISQEVKTDSLRLSLENFAEMQNKMPAHTKTEREQSSTSHDSTLSSDRLVKDEANRLGIKSHRRILKPVEGQQEKLVKGSPAQTARQVLTLRQIKTANQQEDLERYQRDIVEEGKRIEKTVMAGATFYINRESQIENLEILRQAVIAQQISPQLQSMTNDLIGCLLDIDGMRLSCLLRKYQAYRSVRQMSYNLNKQLLAAQELDNGQQDCRLNLLTPVVRPTYSRHFLNIEAYKLANKVPKHSHPPPSPYSSGPAPSSSGPAPGDISLNGQTQARSQMIENCPVTGIQVSTDDQGVKRVKAVETTHGTIQTPVVVNCAAIQMGPFSYFCLVWSDLGRSGIESEQLLASRLAPGVALEGVSSAF
ncbi:hypothetical protein DPEC_G00333110 [Dallia pectoralis]|uniref:Uncharacterized protein n=1 Tax=Dallia pectoralis TaxID=75939 RepID=A0ACC2F692_DALPE|nr:hypothetical protein DPEC_G00333110 [Dallia pectoralis]